MRYFLLEQDKGYTDIPVPLGWYEILAPGKAMESLKKLPRRTIFKIKYSFFGFYDRSGSDGIGKG